MHRLPPALSLTPPPPPGPWHRPCTLPQSCCSTTRRCSTCCLTRRTSWTLWAPWSTSQVAPPLLAYASAHQAPSPSSTCGDCATHVLRPGSAPQLHGSAAPWSLLGARPPLPPPPPPPLPHQSDITPEQRARHREFLRDQVGGGRAGHQREFRHVACMLRAPSWALRFGRENRRVPIARVCGVRRVVPLLPALPGGTCMPYGPLLPALAECVPHAVRALPLPASAGCLQGGGAHHRPSPQKQDPPDLPVSTGSSSGSRPAGSLQGSSTRLQRMPGGVGVRSSAVVGDASSYRACLRPPTLVPPAAWG